MDDKVKDLLEKIRGTAAVATDAAVDTARIAGRKAGQMVDVAKLNVQLFDLNNDLDEVMRRLGKVMYAAHLHQESPEDVPQLLRQADETAEKIDQVKTRVALLRQSRTCSACGAICAHEDKFCRGCGKTL